MPPRRDATSSFDSATCAGSVSHSQVDLVVCFFDSLNYLGREKDLAACFNSVAGCLKNAGWFVFDVNTVNRLATDWNDSTFVAYDEDDLLCLVRSTYDAVSYRSPLFLTTFQRATGNTNSWIRWDEEHIAYAYSLTRIEVTPECVAVSGN